METSTGKQNAEDELIAIIKINDLFQSKKTKIDNNFSDSSLESKKRESINAKRRLNSIKISAF